MGTFYSRYRRRTLRQRIAEQATSDFFWISNAVVTFIVLCGTGLFIILAVWAAINFIETTF